MTTHGFNREEDSPLVRAFNSLKAPERSLASMVPSDAFISKVVGTKNGGNVRNSESLDYEPMQNKIFYDRQKHAKEGKKKLYGYTGQTLAKFMVTLFTGIITGIFAVMMSKSVSNLFAFKNDFIQEIIDDDGANGVLKAYLWHLAYSIALVTLAVAMVQYWAPAAAGAGVTLVMAYLNGNHVPNLLRMRTLITKFVGTVCAVSAGLPMGPEGPMVHIGACVASVVTYAKLSFLTGRRGLLHLVLGHNDKLKCKEEQIKEKLKVLDEIVSDSDHREFISAGTAAGISSAFGAPVGGVLFAMEEACSFWSRKTAWRCFMAAVFATFTMAQINKGAQHGMIGFSGVKPMDNRDWMMQLPFVLINAAMAGLLGAAFNSLRMWLWKLRASKTQHCLRIGEVIGLAFMCVTCGFFFARFAGKCMPKNPDWGEEYGIKFQCSTEGEHNDLATLFLSSNHHTIINLFSIGHNPGQPFIVHFTKASLICYLIIYVILMSVGAGVAIPGGLFMPSLIVGSSWGALFGMQLRDWLPGWNIQPGVYALMAGTGVLGGVFRSMISLVVLVVEGSHGIELLFGIILAVVVANWVAQHIHHDGVYESELERIANVYMLRDEPPHRMHTLTAEMIMATGVYGFREIDNVGRLMDVLRVTTHNGFPVFGDDKEAGGSEAARLEGLILRSQLLVMLQRRVFCDEQGTPLNPEHDDRAELELETEMSTFFRHNFTHNRFVSATAAPLDNLNLDHDASGSRVDLSSLWIDLRPFMNRSPFVVRKDCSASRAHQAFVSLGLRHLMVVDTHNRVVGMITRKDLDHAAGHGHWRVTPPAPNPRNNFMAQLNIFKKIPSVNFLKALGRNGNSNSGAREMAETPQGTLAAHRNGEIAYGDEHDEDDEEAPLRLAQ